MNAPIASAASSTAAFLRLSSIEITPKQVEKLPLLKEKLVPGCRVFVALIDAGVPRIRLLNRTRERAKALADEFGPVIEVLNWDQRADALSGAALLVQTTNQGMVGEPALDLALNALPTSALVADIVYTPLQTPLLAQAQARGNACVNGLGMLLHQARPAFASWFGVEPQVTPALRQVVLGTLRE